MGERDRAQRDHADDEVARVDRLLDADTSGLTGPGGTDASLRGWLEAQLVDVQLHTTDASRASGRAARPDHHPHSGRHEALSPLSRRVAGRPP